MGPVARAPRVLRMPAEDPEDRPSGRHRAPSRSPLGWWNGGQGLPAVLVVLISVWLAVGITLVGPQLWVIAPLLICVLPVLAWLGLRDFPTFVLAALMMRSTLDAFPPIGSLNVGAILGSALLALGVWWIVCQVRAGTFHRPSLIGLALIALSLSAGLATLASQTPLASVQEWMRLTGVVTTYLVVEEMSRRGPIARPFVIATFLAVPIPVAAAVSQAASGQGLFEAGGFSRVTGTFRHSNPLASFLVVLWLLILGLMLARSRTRWMRWGLIAVLALLLGVIVATYTRSAWLALSVGAIVMLLHFPKRYLAGALAVVVSVVILVPGITERFADLTTEENVSGTAGNSLEWRLRYWARSVELAQESPIVGLGLTAVAQSTEEGQPPHSDVVRSYVETGVLGLLSLTVLALAVLGRTWRAATLARARSDLEPWERGVAHASPGIAAAFILLLTVANMLTQQVIMLYLMTMLALASGALRRWEGALPDNARGAGRGSRKQIALTAAGDP